MAAKLGELATELTGDEEAGKDVARRLVNGESLESQAYIKTVGFLQNLLGQYVPDILALGFNKSAEPAQETSKMQLMHWVRC